MPDIDPVGRGTIVQRSKRIPVRNIAYKYVCQDRSFAAVVSNTRKINRFLDPFGYLGMYPINNFPLGLFRSADVVGRSYPHCPDPTPGNRGHTIAIPLL